MSNTMEMLQLVLLFALTLMITILQGEILRLPCKYFGNFSIIKPDHVLQGSVITTLLFKTDEECESACLRNSQCKSYNKESIGDKRCELNDKTTEIFQDNATLIMKSNWTYKSTDYKYPLVGENCQRMNPCDAGVLCRDTCYCPGYQCYPCRTGTYGLRCKVREWHKVYPAMVLRVLSKGVTITQGTDASGGLQINGKVFAFGCGKPDSHFLVHIKGEWTKIRYTQVFKGAASCWAIFGQDVGGLLPYKAGLEVFSATMGDTISNQKKMGSSNDDQFDGISRRCDNLKANFWHELNGGGERHATVVLRRKQDVKDAGIYTYTACGYPQYIIKDIYVFI